MQELQSTLDQHSGFEYFRAHDHDIMVNNV